MHRLGAQALHLRQPWEGARSLHESHPRHLSSVGDCSPRRVPRNSIQCPGDRTDCLVQLGSGKPPPFSPLLSRRHNSSLSSDQQVHPPSSTGLRSSLHLRQGVSSAHGAPNGDLLPEAPAESGNLLIEWPFKPVGLRHRVYHPDGRCPDLCDQVSTQEESFLQQQPFRRQQPER